MLLLGSLKSVAQVNDVSFTVSPAAEYIWWDKDLSIDNMFPLITCGYTVEK